MVRIDRLSILQLSSAVDPLNLGAEILDPPMVSVSRLLQLRQLGRDRI